MPMLKVAAAQIECRPGDVAANLAVHLRTIDEARGKGVDLLLFPELSLTDYLSTPDLGTLARTADAPELAEIAEAAGDMLVSFGFIEATDDGSCRNSQAIVGSGRVLHIHRKVNLPTYGELQEGKHYTPGRAIETVNLKAPWVTSTLICADAWNPAIPWLAALKGASLLLVPVASALDAVGGDFDNPGGWDVTVRHIALTYGLPIVMTNHCGTRGGLRFWGGSRIIDPFGREIARAGNLPALVTATLDHDDVRLAQFRLPTIRDADPDFIHAELGRLLQTAS